MKTTLTIAVLAAGLFVVGCVDHSEDFQSTTPTPSMAPATAAPPAPQPVTPATTLPSTMAPPTTAPAGNP